MRDHQDGRAQLCVHAAKQLHERARIFRVERARRLVGEDERGRGDDGARTRDALPLSARELVRELVEQRPDAERPAHPFERAAGVLSARAAQIQRQNDILAGGEGVEQIIFLKDKPEAVAAVARLLLLAHMREGDPLDGDVRPR